MPPPDGFLFFLHAAALWAFVGATAGSLLLAVRARMRLRRPVLAWRPWGRVPLPPLGPTLFLALVAGGLGHAWWMGHAVSPTVLVGYPAGGLFWLAATWLLQSVVVTDYGIVPQLGRPGQAVVWSRIVDYVDTVRAGHSHFVFLYRGSDGVRRRLDVPVPRSHASAFRTIVQRKLDSRLGAPDPVIADDAVFDRLDDRMDRP